MTMRKTLYMKNDNVDKTIVTSTFNGDVETFTGTLDGVDLIRVAWSLEFEKDNPSQMMIDILDGDIIVEHDNAKVMPNPVVQNTLCAFWDETQAKIDTIKLCRFLTECGLKEAKDYCEEHVFGLFLTAADELKQEFRSVRDAHFMTDFDDAVEAYDSDWEGGTPMSMRIK